MSLTVGKISDKISELRSKIAIFEGLILYLRSNYKSADSMSAEMHFTRQDHATVPEEHIDVFIDETEDHIKQMKAELHQWEDLPVPAPEEQPVPAENIRKGKKVNRGTTRRHQDHSASGEDGPEEAG